MDKTLQRCRYAALPLCGASLTIPNMILLGTCGIRASGYRFDSAVYKETLLNGSSEFIGEMASEQLVEQSSFSQGITLDDIEDSGKRITIEHLDPMLVVYERKKGNYHNLPAEWCEFIEKYSHLISEDTLYIECTIDDPSITHEDNCMYELCQTIASDHPALNEDPGLLTHMFDGGTYAVYHFKGFPQFLFMVYQEVFCRWLSRTGNQLDERPILDIYRYVGEDGYMEIDICFPIQ